MNFDNHATITVRCLTHWGRVTHIGVSKLTIIGSDNGLSPGRRQAIIWTNAGILLIGLLGTNFNEIFIEIHTFSFKKIHLKMSSRKWRPFCLGLNVLISSMISRIRHDVTHRCQNKIDAISQRKFSNLFLLIKMLYFDWNCTRKGQIENESALLPVMTLSWTGETSVWMNCTPLEWHTYAPPGL